MKRLILLASMFLCLLLPSAVAAAAPDSNPLHAACNSGGSASSSSVCDANSNKGTDPISGSNGVLEKAAIILASLGGVTAIIIIIIAAISMVTSGGDSGRVAKARSAIIGALIGLLLIGAAFSIVTFVVSKVG